MYCKIKYCYNLNGSILKVGDNPLFQGKFSIKTGIKIIAFHFEKLEFEFGWPALLYVLFWALFLVRSVSFTKQ